MQPQALFTSEDPARTVPAVLLVDDRPENLLAFEAGLRGVNARFLTAASGRKAIELANEHDLAAIVLDMQMPELSGLATARILKASERTRQIPIIFVTAGQPNHADIAAAYEAGAADYLWKPVDPEVLRAKVAVFVSLQGKRAAEHEGQTLDTLHRVTTALLSELHLDRIVKTLTEHVTALTGAEFGAFFYNVEDQHGESYMLYTLAGAPHEAFAKFGMPRNTPLFAPTFRGEAVVRLDDVTKDPRYGQMAPHYGMPEGHLRVRSYLAVPVTNDERKVLGGLFLGHSEVGRFTAHHERLVSAIALQASVAMTNAKLYASAEEARRRAERAEAALRTSETRLRLAIAATGIGTWDFDPESGRLLCDARCTELLGLPVGAPVDYDVFRAALHPDDRASVEEQVRRALDPQRNEPYYAEYRVLVESSGEERWLEAKGQTVFQGDRAQRLVGTVLDITERKRSETERSALVAREQEARAAAELARQRAEAANRAKDEFLATASHELRNPLSAILGWSRMLTTKSVGPEQLKRALTIIERNARVQVQLVEDILDVSRIITGKLRIVPTQVEVRSVIDAALETARVAAVSKGVKLEAQYGEATGDIVADPDRLQQIVWNLVSNAVKFTPEGGSVCVRCVREQTGLLVEVRDTGQGIAPAALPFVFDRFWQDDGSTTRTHGGLGLGLAIVRHLVELHGGSVGVRSDGFGKGAVFSVQLPIRAIAPPAESGDEAQRESGTTMHEPRELHGLRVVVLDDEEDARELVAFALQDAGAEVATAASAREAFELVTRRVPDVLVSDIGMPGEDGYALIRRIRGLAGHPAQRVPAVALTAYARQQDKRRALAAGFHMHVAKPIEPALLVCTVANVVGRGGVVEVAREAQRGA